MTLESLPNDIIILILQSLSAQDTAALSRTCWVLNSLVGAAHYTSCKYSSDCQRRLQILVGPDTCGPTVDRRSACLVRVRIGQLGHKCAMMF